MKNYFEEFYKHYIELKEALEKKSGDLLEEEYLDKAISFHYQDLNNLIMAGLGMATLYLRMGAIIMIAEELAKPDDEKNISFLKVVADNLVPKPPNDGEWTNIWVRYLELNTNSIWKNLIEEANHQNISKVKFEIRHFVEFRNNIAHQKISLVVDYLKQIKDGFNAFRVMAKFKDIFIKCSFEENTQLVFFSKELGKPINVWPYIRVDEENKKEAIGRQPFQANVEGIVPYLFSGKYQQGAKFINTQGGETNKEQDDDIEDNFKDIQKIITNFNGDRAFNFNEKITNYNEWCIGRDDEVNAIIEWIKKETDKNVLPIFAPAGLGKGALVAELIKNLKDDKTKHLFHFCGSGAANNLQAILYHLIIQGKSYEYLDKNNNKQKKNIWNNLYLPQKLQARFDRLPTQYIDVIELFQALLKITEPESDKKNTLTVEESSMLVIIIDGLDEAAVADHSKRISDWFYTYNEKGERAEKWVCPEHVKWVFTYRDSGEKDKKGYQFESYEFNTFKLDLVQPLKGLTEEAVKKGLQDEFKDLEPALSDDFLETIIKKGAVK
jgi:hypothetical protein